MKKNLIVITGASSGIGMAVAKQFSSQGYPLLLIARRHNNLEKMELPNTLCLQVDIREQSDVQKAVEQAEKLYGAVGCLVNCAGVMYFGKFGLQQTVEWQEMIQTNVLGVLNGMQAVINSMRERKTGTIINISSIAGQKTLPNAASYCASKFAVNALSESIRAELAVDDVRVITISPGGVATDLHTHMNDKQEQENYQKWIDEINLLTPDELANMVLYSYLLPQHICLRQVVIAPTNQTI